MPRPQVIVGSRVVVYVNGSAWGRCMSFELTSETPNRAIETIDEIMPAELAPTRVRAKGSVKLYRLAGDGGIEGAGITAPFSDIPRQKYFSLTLKDRFTDTTLFQCDYCMVDSQHWGVEQKGVMMGSFSFTAITWGNETSAKSGLPS